MGDEPARNERNPALSDRFLLAQGADDFRLLEAFLRLHLQLNAGHLRFDRLAFGAVSLYPPAFDWPPVVALRDRWRRANTEACKNRIRKLVEVYLQSPNLGPGTSLTTIKRARRDLALFVEIAKQSMVGHAPLKRAISEAVHKLRLTKVKESAGRKIWGHEVAECQHSREVCAVLEAVRNLVQETELKDFLASALTGGFGTGFPEIPAALRERWNRFSNEMGPRVQYLFDASFRTKPPPVPGPAPTWDDVLRYEDRAGRYLDSCAAEIRAATRPRRRPATPDPTGGPAPGTLPSRA